MGASSAHIRHCIDLLRQTLTCQLDTTVELKNTDLGGVTGFGTQHQCKDWKQLMQWTSKWEDYDPDERSSEENHTHGTMKHTKHSGDRQD